MAELDDMGNDDALADDTVADEREIAEQIALLGAQVHAEDVERRRLIVSQLSHLCYEVGRQARAAVPILLRCLSDPNEKVGESALWGLQWCAPESIEPLTDCLGSTDAKVRRRACSALGSIGDEASTACDALRRLLTDPAEDVRRRAAWALGLLHDTSARTIDALFGMASSERAAERSSALHALGNIGRALVDPEPLRAKQEQILNALEDDDEDVRWSACYVLESLHVEELLHVDLLVRRLRDASSHVRESAIGKLQKLALTVDLTPHVASISNVVLAGSHEARVACDVLALLGPKAKSAVPHLAEALQAEDGFLAIAAAKALWKIDGRVTESLPVLARLFDEYGESVCDAICEIGPAAGPLIHEVIKALQSDNWDLQWAAADALGAISSSEPEVLAVLATSLGHASPIVRAAAARALAQIGRPAVPILIKLLEGHHDDRAEWAADALGRMGHRANEAAEALRANLGSLHHGLVSWCAIALAKVAGDATAAPILMDLLARTDRPDLRREAAKGLKAIGPPAICATEELTSALDDDHAEVRAAVEEALAAIGARSH
jgi:HEAT repeat protein